MTKLLIALAFLLIADLYRRVRRLANEAEETQDELTVQGEQQYTGKCPEEEE